MDVTQASFEEEVLRRSAQTPVLVDFWASWCQPCQMLMPILTRLAERYDGKFFLAKVNADGEQGLAARYGVRSLPTVMLFRDGKPVDQFLGAQSEGAVCAFLDAHLPRASDALRAQAASLRAQGDLQAAAALLRRATTEDPDNPRVAYDLIATMLDAGGLDEADELLRALPMALRQEEDFRALEANIRVRRRAHAAGGADVSELARQVKASPDDLEARSQLAAQLILAGQLEAAMDQYLEIMRRDRNYADQTGRKGLLELFQLLGDEDPRVSAYRRRMAALLY